jgi:hypothetical protein
LTTATNLIEDEDIKTSFGPQSSDKIIPTSPRPKRIDSNLGGGTGKTVKGMKLYVFVAKLF